MSALILTAPVKLLLELLKVTVFPAALTVVVPGTVKAPPVWVTSPPAVTMRLPPVANVKAAPKSKAVLSLTVTFARVPPELKETVLEKVWMPNRVFDASRLSR